MTNLEKVIQEDKEKFVKEIAEKICFFDTIHHKVRVGQPPLCGDCKFGERRECTYKWKCHTEDIIEWLNSEVEE